MVLGGGHPDSQHSNPVEGGPERDLPRVWVEQAGGVESGTSDGEAPVGNAKGVDGADVAQLSVGLVEAHACGSEGDDRSVKGLGPDDVDARIADLGIAKVDDVAFDVGGKVRGRRSGTGVVEARDGAELIEKFVEQGVLLFVDRYDVGVVDFLPRLAREWVVQIEGAAVFEDGLAGGGVEGLPGGEGITGEGPRAGSVGKCAHTCRFLLFSG